MSGRPFAQFVRQVFVAGAVLIAGSAVAQPINDYEGNPAQMKAIPDIGVVRTVSVGEAVFKTYHYRNIAVLTLLSPIGWKKARNPVPAGTELYQVKSKAGIKACADLGQGRCGIDEDSDGDFDRGDTANWSLRGAILNAPAPYRKRVIEVPLAADPFTATIIYTGATNDTLRLSYREFANDMARAAFTEDLTIPITKKFPQLVAFKGIRMRVLGIDGVGMTYVIEGMQPLAPTAPATLTSTP